MYFKNLLDVLNYPNIKSLVKYYLWKNPSLCYAGYDHFSNHYFSSKLEEITNEKLISNLQMFLPPKFINHLENNGFKEFDGFRLLIYVLVRKFKPEIVIETGVASGASTAFILCAMHQNNKGSLYSIDLPPKDLTEKDRDGYYKLEDGAKYSTENQNTGYLVPDYLKYRWNLIYGDSKKELPNILNKLKTCSIFFHDSLHTYQHMQMEYNVAWPHIEKGGFLISHDVIWNKAFLEFTKKTNRKPTIYNSLGVIRK